jgi:hypothetical protein
MNRTISPGAVLMKLMSLTFLLTTFGLLCQSEIYATGEKDTEGSPLIEARYVETGPTIDGDPSDQIWEQAVPDSEFQELGEKRILSTSTTIKVLYDDTFLYLLYTCRGKTTEEIAISTIRRDGSISESDDDIEFFFYPGDQDSLYVQLSTNAIGAKFDSQTSNRDYFRDFTWTAMPGLFEKHWTVELKIPIHQFVEEVEEGDVWRVNFARYVHSGTDSVKILTWAPMIQTLHAGGNFGRMRFDRGTTFEVTPLDVDWTEDESMAISNLRQLRGSDVYQPIRDYLDIALTLRTPKRPFEVLSQRVYGFIKEFPDSSNSLEFALRAIFPAASGYRVPPPEIEAFARKVETTLDLRGAERDLLDLSRGLYYNDIGQREKWIDIYTDLSVKDPRIRATAAYYLLSRVKPRPSASSDDKNLIKDALDTFTDLAVTGSAPLHLTEGAIWIATSPSRSGIYSKFYNVLKRASPTMPEEVMELVRSLWRLPEVPDELALVLRKTEFEQYADRRGPHYLQQKADSLILVIAPLDKEYTQSHLNSLLGDRLRELDVIYSEMDGTSLPEEVVRAINLRNHYEGFHIIDMVFALCYETVDSLDKAVEYLENYQKSLGKKWQRSGPILRYLAELTYRRDHRQDPGFFDIPRDAYRLVYRTQGFRKPSSFLDISSDGRAAIYALVPDSLDPRNEFEITVPTLVDSPAVAFHLSTGEIDSLHSLLSKYDFLRFKLKYMEPCNRCANTEITVITPRNARTIHLQGENLSKDPFELNKYVSQILDRYFQSLQPLHSDWKGMLTYYTLWGKYNSPGKSSDQRLDLLLELFKNEPMKSSWQNEERYIEPLTNLGEETGRTTEVKAAIAIKYFDSIFKWKSYVKERLPDKETEEVAKTIDYLEKASMGTRKESRREWFKFLSVFTRNFSGDLANLSKEIENLNDPGNRGDARAILIWLACATGDLDLAGSIHEALLSEKTDKGVQFESTLRLMLSNRDHNRPEEALDYIMQIEKYYGKYLRDGRDRPIRELKQYSRIDLVLDKALLSFSIGDLAGTETLVRSIDESEVPADMMNEFNDLLRIVKYRELPSTYSMLELSDYLHILSASSHSGLHELNARWAMWLLDNINEPKLRSQVISMLRRSFHGRESWDELQKKMARTLLDDYRSDTAWKSVDLTERILDKVLEQGDVGDVVEFWREEILPHPMKLSRITALNRLADYFDEHRDHKERLGVIEKILVDLRQESTDLPVSKLILLKYSLDLADLYTVNFDRREAGITLVDSLTESLTGLDPGTYPYAFAVIAEWKAKNLGWDAFADFVNPHVDSLLRIEKELGWSVYRRHVIPDTPLSSPLLALRCIVQQSGFRGQEVDFLEILGLTPDTADTVLKNLKTSPRRLNLSCEQAQLITWKDTSFEALLEQYNQRVR